MAKATPIIRSFNGGEFSPLMDARTDLDRYPSSTRQLLNYIAVPQGPALGRSGTFFMSAVADEERKSSLVPFVFSETQALMLEFSHLKMRIHTEDGVVVDDLSQIYEIDTPYTEDFVPKLRYVQSGDVVYLLCSGYVPYKLTRYGATDWRIVAQETKDGPYAPTNNTATKLTASGTGELGMSAVITVPAAAQTVTIEYTPTGGPAALRGYFLRSTGGNSDPDYGAIDSAPSDWILQGYNGSTWVTIDQKIAYVLYDNKRTPFFEITSPDVYSKYQIVVTAVRRNGPVQPSFAAVFAKAGTTFNVVASSVVGINRDQGFLPTDVGRLIRYKSLTDGTWGALRITAQLSSTVVTVKCEGAPLSDQLGTTEWRLGYWSATTGFPTCGTFFDDRLWLGGSIEYPDVIAGSVTGAYDNFQQTSEAGVVADDNAVVFQLNSRRISRIVWLQSDERGLLIGTGAGEWTVTSGERDGPITGRSFRARNSTARGSADIEPVKVDRQIVYVQRSKRTAREFTYVFEADGYKSPSMSLFSSHLGVPGFEEMDYAAEPHSIVWLRRSDGKIAGLTYNRDENVVGWHIHDFAGGFVESMAVLPSVAGSTDALWLVVRRTVNGQTRRYIERMSRFFDFDMTLADVHLVDCALRYVGSPQTVFTNLEHLEGETVYGLADGSPFTATVANGAIRLDYEASNVIVGLGYDAAGITNRIEAGAADGTAQGKIKRITKLTLRVWQSVGGLIGPNEDSLVEVEQRMTEDSSAALPLFDGDIPNIEYPGDYETDGCIMFKRAKDKPLPFNLVAIVPQLNTQDG